MTCPLCDEECVTTIKFELPELFWLECSECGCEYANSFIMNLNVIIKNGEGDYNELIEKIRYK